MIEFRNVSKQYGENAGLNDVSITIEEGEFVFLVGPSGAGKSTLIKLLLKEKEPDEGAIFFDGEEVTDMPNRLVPLYRRKIGIVFQDFRLLRKKTVYENVAFAMEAVHKRKKLIDMQVPHLLKLVGISEKADRYPDELSGGEAQRVAIARAMVNNPKALIADEPTGNLDPEKAWEIMNLLNQINIRGTTILMVTHAKDIVDRMGKRVVQLEGGKVVRDDRTGLYIENPLVTPDQDAEQTGADQETGSVWRRAARKAAATRPEPAAAVSDKKPRPTKSRKSNTDMERVVTQEEKVSQDSEYSRESVQRRRRDTAEGSRARTEQQAARGIGHQEITGSRTKTLKDEHGSSESHRTDGVDSRKNRVNTVSRTEASSGYQARPDYRKADFAEDSEKPSARTIKSSDRHGSLDSRKAAARDYREDDEQKAGFSDTQSDSAQGTRSRRSLDSSSGRQELREARYRKNVERRVRTKRELREEKRERTRDIFSQAEEMNYWEDGDMFD